MQRTAKHLAYSTNLIVLTLLSTTTSEMLRCALHDRPLCMTGFYFIVIPE